MKGWKDIIGSGVEWEEDMHRVRMALMFNSWFY